MNDKVMEEPKPVQVETGTETPSVSCKCLAIGILIGIAPVFAILVSLLKPPLSVHRAPM